MADSPFEEIPASSRAPSGTVRFTIGGLLVVTAFAAIFVGGLFAFPPVVSAAIAALMGVCIPAVLVGCLIYGGAGSRAFAIGMLVPKAMQIISGVFGGMGARPSSAEMRQLIQQQAMLQSRGSGVYGGGPVNAWNDTSAFTYFAQMSEYWNRFGHAYMTEEALFWAGSAIAGVATLMVQRHFSRAERAAAKKIGGLAS